MLGSLRFAFSLVRFFVQSVAFALCIVCVNAQKVACALCRLSDAGPAEFASSANRPTRTTEARDLAPVARQASI
jgi:hypothetical protein